MKTATAFLAILILTATWATAEPHKINFNYNRVFFDEITGVRIYKGGTAETATVKIADIPRAQLTVISENPVLLHETFDSDPGTKYPLASGAWKWVPETQNMQITGTDNFMLVFTLPAGASNDMVYSFWPLSLTGDKPIIYNYIKYESIGAYYELRFAGISNTSPSNWRKVYSGKWGGVDGAFPLPGFDECHVQTTGNTICNGYRVFLSWQPGDYNATISKLETGAVAGHAAGSDKAALDINKLEFIIQNQTGWIDDIIIGGQMTVQAPVDFVIDTERTFIAVSGYRVIDGKIVEGPRSVAGEYVPSSGQDSTALPAMPARIWVKE